jgi:hypothetical protein
MNTQSYSNMLSNLSGGRKRKHSKVKRRHSRRSYRRSRSQNQNQNQNQNGGFFPGIGEVITQAVVPFGLYAAQHKFKSSSSKKFRTPSKYSFKKLNKFKFTRKL